MENNLYLPWVEKYRPKDIDNIISHKHIIKTIKSMINNNNIPHLLLYGPAGTGKTSTALVISKYIFSDASNSNILELNASDDRNISTVRNEIKSFASSNAIFSNGIKVIILDEADAMTSQAQMALRRIIEIYSTNIRFIIICNNIDNILQAIQSRCSKFRFPPVDFNSFKIHIENIIEKENINVDKNSIQSISNISKGDLRKAINILQSIYLNINKNIIKSEDIYNIIGYPSEIDTKIMIDILFNKDRKYSVERFKNWKNKNGLSLSDIIYELSLLLIEYDIPKKYKSSLLKNLADIEFFSSKGTNDIIHLSAIVGIFQDVVSKLSN